MRLTWAVTAFNTPWMGISYFQEPEEMTHEQRVVAGARSGLDAAKSCSQAQAA